VDFLLIQLIFFVNGANRIVEQHSLTLFLYTRGRKRSFRLRSVWKPWGISSSMNLLLDPWSEKLRKKILRSL